MALRRITIDIETTTNGGGYDITYNDDSEKDGSRTHVNRTLDQLHKIVCKRVDAAVESFD